MTDKRPSKARQRKSTPITATATAKIEATARASYTVSKKVLQTIPEDVTRARSDAWPELISPITEWAGLKADAMRAKRSALRIQQEAALQKLARLVRQKMIDRKVAHPLPVKILVPALESASLEAPESDLLQWWADLLVSGATKEPLRPYLVELLNKIGPEEALVLDELWTGYLARNWKSSSLGVLSIRNTVSSALGHMISHHQDLTKHFGVDDHLEYLSAGEKFGHTVAFLFREILKMGRSIGVPIGYEMAREWSGRESGQSKQFANLEAKHVELEVCQALRLAVRHEVSDIHMGRFVGLRIYIWPAPGFVDTRLS